MNKWQEYYLNNYLAVMNDWNGRPNINRKKCVNSTEFKLLGLVNDYVIVNKREHGIEKIKVNFEKNDVPNGLMNVDTLASNLQFWVETMGYEVEYH